MVFTFSLLSGYGVITLKLMIVTGKSFQGNSHI